jgi:hypothetical protein
MGAKSTSASGASASPNDYTVTYCKNWCVTSHVSPPCVQSFRSKYNERSQTH